jgi:hypothetical protein
VAKSDSGDPGVIVTLGSRNCNPSSESDHSTRGACRTAAEPRATFETPCQLRVFRGEENRDEEENRDRSYFVARRIGDDDAYPRSPATKQNRLVSRCVAAQQQSAG